MLFWYCLTPPYKCKAGVGGQLPHRVGHCQYSTRWGGWSPALRWYEASRMVNPALPRLIPIISITTMQRTQSVWNYSLMKMQCSINYGDWNLTYPKDLMKSIQCITCTTNCRWSSQTTVYTIWSITSHRKKILPADWKCANISPIVKKAANRILATTDLRLYHPRHARLWNQISNMC